MNLNIEEEICHPSGNPCWCGEFSATKREKEETRMTRNQETRNKMHFAFQSNFVGLFLLFTTIITTTGCLI